MNLGPHVIGVCSWSFKPKSVADIVAGVKRIGLEHVQLALAPYVSLNQENRKQSIADLKSSGLKFTAGMVSFPGEDYSTIPSIRKSGGFVPDEKWDERKAICQGAAEIAAEFSISQITTHIGFVPEKSNPSYATMISRTREIADLFSRNFLSLGLETGQETAVDLVEFLTEVDRKNIFVNFDPANMILYGAGDPIEAIGLIANRIRHVHVKDANASTKPGQEWGKEMPIGEGQVNIPKFIEALRTISYTGPLVIEREAGQDRAGDARAAIETLRQYFGG